MAVFLRDFIGALRRNAARLPRPASGVAVLILVLAGYLSLCANGAFWKAVVHAADIGWGHNLSFGVALAAAMMAFFTLVLSLLGVRYLFKPAVIALLLLAAVTSYFMGTYGVVVDDTMVRNVLETDPGEAGGLLNVALIRHVVLWGVLPALVVVRWRVRYRGFWRESGIRLLTVALALGVLGVSVYTHYKDFSLVLREHRELRYLVNPTYPLYAIADTFMRTAEANDGPIRPLGDGAQQAARAAGAPRRVFVLVVGETARAADFSLDGYARPTNPRLSRRDIINFPDFSSCGTSTAVSVPCMFSNQTRAHFDNDRARRSENLLDVLVHAGVTVRWRENNSGCKDVCARVPTRDLSHAEVDGVCGQDHCFDDVLLHGLVERIRNTPGDVLIVLHQMGSHGPEYYRRYPPAFARFTPVCDSNLPQDCTHAEIVNAYDNTLLYTDHVLDELIGTLARLARQPDTVTGMFYLSDHGESLGENGLYLHGFPYAMAPSEQTHIPALAWFSPGFGVDRACMTRIADRAYSQDNLFDTVLGLFDVRTRVYTPSRDIFRACRDAGAGPA